MDLSKADDLIARLKAFVPKIQQHQQQLVENGASASKDGSWLEIEDEDDGIPNDSGAAVEVTVDMGVYDVHERNVVSPPPELPAGVPMVDTALGMDQYRAGTILKDELCDIEIVGPTGRLGASSSQLIEEIDSTSDSSSSDDEANGEDTSLSSV
eukprot:Protomagalhaensia_sp_Gyna_25__3577@NODE_3212_length_677_cov_16_078370_g2691_i0_p1_GENE_NODE_3212_length_677_cov_16_078370_g2691_i0NODE_3212_length_677_cov_16_078370_g2691_i0_p1_ORF_typecomplete_len154_score35_42DUF4598/PF15370_6/1_8e06_NODE_3212_length_677_cov_16_078370_g2691_i092553